MRNHFPLNLTQTEHEAEAAMVKFHNCFGKTQYLSPYRFYNSDGVNVTDGMHQSPRPVNMYFLETKVDLPLENMGEPSTITERCDLTYFLHLLQSLDSNVVSSSERSPQDLSSSSSNL